MKMQMVDLSKIPVVDSQGIMERVARIQARSLKGNTKRTALKLALSMLDITTLEGADTPEKVRQMCIQAIQPNSQRPELGSAAAVCVYPEMVGVARRVVDSYASSVKVASVATAFPSGLTPMHLRLEEVRCAVESGADEIDMVLSRSHFLAGKYEEVFNEVVMVKEVCGATRLKVILETGELKTCDNIRLASELAMAAGADFIKTSTGKISSNATLANTLVMLYAIKDYYENTGRKVGIKPAGGIANSKIALQYLLMVREVLGRDWLKPKWLRFGASSLLIDILMQIEKQHSGNYQSSNYFPKD